MTNRDWRVFVAEPRQVKHASPLEEVKKPIKAKDVLGGFDASHTVTV